jgi:hypothetical protein
MGAFAVRKALGATRGMKPALLLSTRAAVPTRPTFSLRDARGEFERGWKRRNHFAKFPRSLERAPNEPSRYASGALNEEWAAFLSGARWRAPTAQAVDVLARRTQHRLFAGYWTLGHPADDYDPKIWLKRDDIWRKGGYRQPVVHWAFESFTAGIEWSAKLPVKPRRRARSAA